MNKRGVTYITYGEPAFNEASLSIRSLKKRHQYPVSVISDGIRLMAGVENIRYEEIQNATPGRDAKTSLYRLSPYAHTLFLDADTRVNGDLRVGFSLLDAGYELVMVASEPQGDRLLEHLKKCERQMTLAEMHNPLPLQLNTGVMFWRRCKNTARLWGEWREEWRRWQDKDQGALLRVLDRLPVKLFLLGYPFNYGTGAVISHHFGRAARKCCGG